MENWLINIGSGVIGSILTGLAVVLWRRFWNPVRWRLEQTDPNKWRAIRVSGPDALAIKLGFAFTPGATLSLDRSNEKRKYPRRNTENIDLEPGESAVIGQISKSGAYWIEWIERGRRRSLSFDFTTPATVFEYRRRDIE